MSKCATQSHKVTTGDGATLVVSGGPNYLTGAVVLTDGTNDATVLIQSSDGTTHNEVITLKAAGADVAKDFDFSTPIRISEGVRVTVTGTGATAYVLVGK